MQQKPAELFHGSSNQHIKIFEPRGVEGDINGIFPEGKRQLILATHHENFAALYSLKTPQMLSTSDSVMAAFIRDHDGWRKELGPQGGSVYVLSSDSFTNTLHKNGLPSAEWTSKSEVVPIRVKHFTPEQVMQAGGQLFVLPKEISSEMWHHDEKKPANASFHNRLQAKIDSGALTKQEFSPLHIARELKEAGLIRHLNAETVINPVDLPKSSKSDVVGEDIEWLKKQATLAHLSWGFLPAASIVADPHDISHRPILTSLQEVKR